ncbi:hypothetical protein AAIH70_16615 [Neorhizobium sp. BT27B]|uniref:hypothetical protein n=1 Tax=Neorhizobium sp. BT27B TaxID=3142625 RepID=UPI003D2A5927
MKMFMYGDKSEAYCDACAAFKTTTLKYRDVPFDDGIGVAKQVLVDVCDTCEAVLAIPAQSTPAIREARERAFKPLEVMLPATMVDVIDYAAFTVDPLTTQQFRKPLIAYYLLQALSTKENSERFVRRAQDFRGLRKELRDMPTKRLSMKLSERFYGNVVRAEKDYSVNKTELVGSISLMIKEDIIDPVTPVIQPELKQLAELMTA